MAKVEPGGGGGGFRSDWTKSDAPKARGGKKSGGPQGEVTVRAARGREKRGRNGRGKNIRDAVILRCGEEDTPVWRLSLRHFYGRPEEAGPRLLCGWTLDGNEPAIFKKPRFVRESRLGRVGSAAPVSPKAE